MGKDATIRFLTKLVEGAVLDTDREPEKHAAYVKAMKQTCGSGCRLCQANKGTEGVEKETKEEGET
jgi:hypothetical protein